MFYIKLIINFILIISVSYIILKKFTNIKINQSEDDSYIKYKYAIFVALLFYMQGNLYLQYFKFYTFAIICFICWALWTLYRQSNKNKIKTLDISVNKVEIVFISVLQVITQLVFYIFSDFDDLVINLNKKEFSISLIYIVILFIAMKSIIDKYIFKYILKDVDNYKKIFMLNEIIFIILISVDSIYSILNFDKFNYF